MAPSPPEPVPFGPCKRRIVSLKHTEAIKYLRVLPEEQSAREQSTVYKLVGLFAQQRKASAEQVKDILDIDSLYGPTMFTLKRYKDLAGYEFLHGPMVKRSNGKFMPSSKLAQLIAELQDQVV
jgi:hypothetical protein